MYSAMRQPHLDARQAIAGYMFAESERTKLLSRTLWLVRASTGFVALLQDETIAYQLQWPS